jgi:hypothetical protein
LSADHVSQSNHHNFTTFYQQLNQKNAENPQAKHQLHHSNLNLYFDPIAGREIDDGFLSP